MNRMRIYESRGNIRNTNGDLAYPAYKVKVLPSLYLTSSRLYKTPALELQRL